MSLSIRGMHDTMVLKEQIMDAYFTSLKPTSMTTHYWHVERKLKNGKWKFVARFYSAKKEMAEIWNKYYRGGNYRLVHMLKYGDKK